MRWQVVTQTFSSSYRPMNESRASKKGDMKASDRSKLIQLLNWLKFWKKNRKSKVLGESTDSPKSCAVDTTALLSDEELEAELQRILPSLPSPESPQSDFATLPQEFLDELEREKQEQARQDIFVSKANNVPLWKRLWRSLFGKNRNGRGPLACHEDSNSTTDSTEYGGETINLHPARSCAHFSVSSTRHYSPHITSDMLDGTESVEIEWPDFYVPQTGAEIAANLQQYLDRHKDEKIDPVEFYQIHPSDSKSVGSAVLAVSFDNHEECAQLVFLNHSTSSEDTDVYDQPLGAKFPHPAAPTIPSVERQYVHQPKKQAPPTWSEMDDALLETNPSSTSVEVSLNDYENGGWSYDDASFSSILSTTLFQPICREEIPRSTSDPLFVPPSYYSGCFTHGPTLLDLAHDEDESSSPSEVSALPPPSLISL